MIHYLAITILEVKPGDRQRKDLRSDQRTDEQTGKQRTLSNRVPFLPLEYGTLKKV